MKLVVVTQCGRWKATDVLVMIENCAEAIIGRGVDRSLEQPKSLGCVHFMQNTVGTVMEKAAVVDHVHPSGVEIKMYVMFHGTSGRVRASFLVRGILCINETTYG
jgi:hypothetical protein